MGSIPDQATKIPCASAKKLFKNEKKKRFGLSYNLIYDNKLHIAMSSSLRIPLNTPMGQQFSSWGALTPGNVLTHSDVSDSL